MNKKIIVLIVAIVIIAIGGIGFWFMSSNSNKSDKKTNNTNENSKVNTNNETSNEKVAIIYFSATGTTRKVADFIENKTGGDSIEIEPKYEYTDDDLDYNNKNSRANKEQNNSKSRPEIQNNLETDSYDVIYLGYPIWWGDVPKIILTFLDTNDLSGKKVIPFCTSGSSGIEESLNTLKNYNKDINWTDGKRFSSGTTQDDINEWVDSINN